MRVAFVGPFQFPIYEEACCAALERLGVEAIRIPYGSKYGSLVGRLERKWSFSGPVTQRTMRWISTRLDAEKPEVILFWRPTLFPLSFISAIVRTSRALLCCYNNDDPFGPIYGQAPLWDQKRWLWRNFINGIPAYDIHFVYRVQNLEEFREAGARDVALLRSYYLPEWHHPVEPNSSSAESDNVDAIFIGHYEPDGRTAALRALRASGVRVRVNGYMWTAAALAELGPGAPVKVAPVEGLAYTRALCAAKVALVFLSRQNRDTYTRRNFEIPACGVPMVSERTDDLLTMFGEDEEAVFFSSTDELVRKTQILLKDDVKRRRIAANGRRRVLADGHSVDARMTHWLEYIRRAMAQRAKGSAA